MTRWPRAAQISGQLGAGLVVEIDHGGAVARQQLGEQPRLGREIGRHVVVIIEMIARQVGEGGGFELQPVEPELVEPVARGFERDMIDAALRQRVADRDAA